MSARRDGGIGTKGENRNHGADNRNRPCQILLIGIIQNILPDQDNPLKLPGRILQSGRIERHDLLQELYFF
jgi:hypothetical protein